MSTRNVSEEEREKQVRTLREFLVEGVIDLRQMREQERDEEDRHAQDGARPEAPLPRSHLLLGTSFAFTLRMESDIRKKGNALHYDYTRLIADDGDREP
jgi:hypothetical protein